MEKNSLIVDGFAFQSAREAENALREQQNIEIIREKAVLSDSSAVYELYEKLIERDMFKTIVGYSFLYELRYRLLHDFGYEEEELSMITIPIRMEYDTSSEKNQGALEKQIERLMLIKKRMTIVIAALIFMIVAMYVIAVLNPNTGYANTENKIINKYSTWQEELEERERAVKEKEAELNIQFEE